MSVPAHDRHHGQQRPARGNGREHLARREPDDLEDGEVAHPLADAEQQRGQQVDEADGEQQRLGAVEHGPQVGALLAHTVLGRLDVELAARRADERGLHRVRVGAVAQLQLVLHGSEARERRRRHRTPVEDRRPPVVVGLDVAPDDAQAKARALGVEREAVADLQVQRVEQAAADDHLARPGEHAPVAHRVGPARVVAAERPRPHVDRAAGHGGRGALDGRGARDGLRLSREQRARPRRRRGVRADQQLVGLGPQRRVLDHAAVGRLRAERHDDDGHRQRQARDRHGGARPAGERVLHAEHHRRRQAQRGCCARGARGLRAHRGAPEGDRLEHAEAPGPPGGHRREDGHDGGHAERRPRPP